MLARLSSLSFIFDSGKLALAKNGSVTAKIHQIVKTAELGQIRYASWLS
jgi:hypothetical protein